MSLIFWQPQVGLASLSITMVRLVSSGNRLPWGAPRGLSINPAGPSWSNRFFQAYNVCLDIPTKAAKSRAGNPLRRQVSNRSRRCAGPNAAGASAGFTKRLPRPRPLEEGATGSVSSPPGKGWPVVEGEEVGAAAGEAVSTPLRSPVANATGSLRSVETASPAGWQNPSESPKRPGLWVSG